MRLHAGITAVLLVGCVSALAAEPCTRNGRRPGIWSAEATEICHNIRQGQSDAERDVEVPSPNGKHRLRVIEKEEQHGLFIDGKQLPIDEEFLSAGVEIAWAPNSASFSLNWSNGGATGGWNLDVFFRGLAGWRKITITDQAQRDFRQHYRRCEMDEKPNELGLHWREDSKTLLFFLEVYPRSTCPDLGKTYLYEVEVPSGRVVARYAQSSQWAGFKKYVGHESLPTAFETN